MTETAPLTAQQLGQQIYFLQNPNAAIQMQRQQALAQQLTDAGNQPDMAPNTLANPGGYVINQSKWGMLGKAIEKGLGSYESTKNNQALAAAMQASTQPSSSQINAATQGPYGSQLTDAAIGQGEGPATQQQLGQKLGQAMQQNGQSNDPLSTMASTPTGQAILSQQFPEYYKANVAPTPDMRLAAAVYGQGTPGYNDAIKAAQQKSTYIPTTNVRAGSTELDPITHKPVFNSSAVPDNTMPVFGQRPDGSQGTVGAAPLPILSAGAQNPPPPPLPNGQLPPPPSGQQPQLPSIPGTPGMPSASYLPIGPGATAAAGAMGKQNADMVNNLRQTASDSPVRQDVYDKILNLSKAGVSTGGGADFYNNIKNMAVNTPVIGPLAEKLTGNPSDYQELSKFLKQNAMRTWQAAGGTGTDTQLEASTEAAPNNKMTPQAIQAMAEFGKAGEMAVNAKNNFMQNAIGQNNENIDKANQYENAWKQHFDPKVYQLSVTGGDPQKMQQITSGLSPAQKTILMGKYQYAKQNGWLQ